MRTQTPGPYGTADTEALAAELAELVPRLYRLLRTALDDDRDAPSLEQLRVMHRIDQGLHNVSALAAARQMRMSAITAIVDVLVDRGWLIRQPDTVDRRRVNVHLTRPGRKALRRGRLLTTRRMQQVIAQCPPGAGLASALEALVAAMEGLDRDARDPLGARTG